MASQPKPEPTPTNAAERPTMRSVSDDYAAAVDKERELNEFIASAEAEIQRLVRTETVTFSDPKAGIRVVSYDTIDAGRIALPSPPTAPEPEAHDPRIISLLGRLTPQKVKNEPPPQRFAAERARIKELSEQLEVARQALELLQPVLHRLRAEASVKLCSQLKSHYAPVAARLCAAQAELARAVIEHDEFLGDLRRQGVALSHLRPCLSRGPNETADPVESIRSVLAWASGHGWFDAEIPARSK